MDQVVPKSGPYCSRCEQPLLWHSTQKVKAGDRDETMEIFRCESCGRLSALPSVNSAA
jgi:RNase P subunit RPR2